MLIEVSTDEAEALKYACVMNDLNYMVFNTEITGIKKVRIRDRGREISAPLAYRLKGIVDQKLRAEQEEDVLNRMSEYDLLPLPAQEQPINVLMMIEALNTEDLPR